MEWYDWFSAGWISGMLLATGLTYLVGWLDGRWSEKIRPVLTWEFEDRTFETRTVRVLDPIDIPLGPHARV